MLNIRNEEKNLKRYLKNKVSLNENTVVKILITGTLAFTLTACGGGGGSSSQGIIGAPGIKSPDEKPEEDIKTETIDKKNEGYEVVGKDVKIEGTITGDTSAKSLTGITAKNSNVESHAEITLASEGSIGISGTTDGKRAVYTIKNNGNISLSGKKSIGMYAKNGVVAENNGVITGSGEGKYQHKNDGTVIEDSFGTIGIGVINGSKGINNKDIIMAGAYTTGMYAENNSTIENNGKISLTSKIVRESEFDGDYYYDEDVYSSERGMRANSNSVAINNGTITGSGQITGIDARESSQGTNNGNIELESLSQDKDNIVSSGEYYKIVQKQVLSKVRGMIGIDEGTVVINNKNIKLAGNAVGIEVDREASGINSGNITLNSVEIETEGYSKGFQEYGIVSDDWQYLEKGKTFSNLVGMYAKSNSKIVNSETGNIVLSGTGFGMKALENSIAENNGTISVEAGKESWNPTISLASQEETIYYNWASVVGMSGNESEIKNNGTINVLYNGIGINGSDSSNILNMGNINIQSNPNEKIGDLDNVGIALEKGSVGENRGNIIIDSNNGMTSKIENIGVQLIDKESSFINNGKIEIEALGEHIIGIASEREVGGKEIENNGEIKVNYLTSNKEQQEIAIGIAARRSILNNGKIEIKANGTRGIGIDSSIWENLENEFKREILNEKDAEIIVVAGIGKGIVANDNDTKGMVSIKNEGLISITGLLKGENYITNDDISTGIEAFSYKENTKGIIINNGRIEVEALEGSRGIDSFGNDVENNGNINVIGEDAIGIKVLGEKIKTTAINNREISINGKNAIGMYAGSNSTAINAEEGVINVGSLAQAGMVADGESALIINKGTINLAQRDGLTEETKDSIALQSINGGKIENSGTINIDGDLNLTTGKNSSYVIGTTKDGEYGKISAKTAKLDGNVVVSTQITKSGFKNEYTLQNVVDAEDITLGDNFKFNSDSLLYDATAKTDTWGNLDATLTRNDKTLADYSTDETKENAEVFGKYYTEESYKKLSSDAQSVISAIDTSSKENLNKDLGELKPTIYSNISRQILDTNKFFKEQEKEVINTLGENEYNFAFIGDYKDVDSKGLIEGYTSKASGFIGAINLGNDIFGTIGYSYNDIDYKDNSNGNIQTIHLGLNKMLTYEKFDISLGLNGEYNFNEYNREIEFLNRNAKSDFNSYAVGFTSEISRVFGKESYLKPYLGLDVTYLNYESFKEKNANSLNVAMDSQDYVSVLPKVGIGIGNKFNNLRTFANVEYSYELGNMNKSQTYMFEGFEGKAKLENDNLENTLVTTKVGASYEMNTLSLTGTVGKEFGKRDNTFVTVSLGYKF